MADLSDKRLDDEQGTLMMFLLIQMNTIALIQYCLSFIS